MKKTSTPSSINSFNNDVVQEILAWLPAKSLMRFKAINKFWGTKIAHDSFFLQLHRRRSSSRIGGEKLLLHINRDLSITYGKHKKHRFISMDKNGGNPKMEYSQHCPNHALASVVDGIVCFYSAVSYTNISATLYNLSTHESIALPEDSNFLKGLWKTSFISFGFDSSHTLCKILHQSKSMDPNIEERGFEVYTLGDSKSSWRIINSPPFEYHYGFPWGGCSFFINGVIYWFFGEDKITAFDINDESFHLISIPIKYCEKYIGNFNGVPTLMETESSFSSGLCYGKLWKLEDYKNQVWVMENILIDIYPRLQNPQFISTIGSGEILIRLGWNDMVLIFHDRARMMSKVLELTELLVAAEGETYDELILCYTYMENIMPLTSVSNLCI